MKYIPHTEIDRKLMLDACGVSSIDEFFSVIPDYLKPASFDIPQGLSEMEILPFFERLAANNRCETTCFIGGGFYDHFIPAVVDAIASRSEFYTSYTPYQPELSQGTLQAIYEFQTAICRLTALAVSNASMYDGGTALYEACRMATNVTGRRSIVIDCSVNPLYRRMLRSYAAHSSIEFREIACDRFGRCDRTTIMESINESTAALVVQNPNFFGTIDDYSAMVERCHQSGALAIQSVYPVAMALVKPPGDQGFDIATGEGQSLGIPLSFGGPYLGFMAARKELVRKIPGRIVARTTDLTGKEGFVLSLQAREQHIRREKSVSNICSNQALCALRALVYCSVVGKKGFFDVAQLCIEKTAYAQQRICAIPGVKAMNSLPFFNEFVVKLPINAEECACTMAGYTIAAGLPLGNYYPDMKNNLLIAVTEKRTKAEIDRFADTLERVICR